MMVFSPAEKNNVIKHGALESAQQLPNTGEGIYLLWVLVENAEWPTNTYFSDHKMNAQNR